MGGAICGAGTDIGGELQNKQTKHSGKMEDCSFQSAKAFQGRRRGRRSRSSSSTLSNPCRSRDFFNDPGFLIDEDEEKPPMVGRRQLRSDTKAKRSRYAVDGYQPQTRLDWQLSESHKECEVQPLFIEEIKIEPGNGQPHTDQHHQTQNAVLGTENHDGPTMENVDQSEDTKDHQEVYSNDREDEDSAVAINDNHQDDEILNNQPIAR